MDYFEWRPDARYQLYNLASDPAESENLAEHHPGIVEELAGELNAIREGDRSHPHS